MTSAIAPARRKGKAGAIGSMIQVGDAVLEVEGEANGLGDHGPSISAMSRVAGLSRRHLRTLLARHGLFGGRGESSDLRQKIVAL